jgi:hypothetical protein
LRKFVAASNAFEAQIDDDVMRIVRRLVYLDPCDAGLLARGREPLERLKPQAETGDLVLGVQYGHGSMWTPRTV